MHTLHRPLFRPRSNRGFTLVELLIAVLLAAFLLGGLFAIVQSNRRAFTTQSTLSQQQDSERFAMTVLADVIQHAGFYNNPLGSTLSSAFPAAGAFVNAAQTVTGTSGGAQGDTITVRYVAGPADALLNCDGSTTTPNGTWTNQFSVNGSNQLVCSVNGATAVPLVDGVTGMTVTYGVHTTGGTSTNVDTYIPAAQMVAANWPNVSSVVITLTFTNALATSAAQQTVSLTRTIAIQGKV